KQANRKKKCKNSTAPSTSQVQCYSCKQYGHKSFECSVSKKKQHDVSSNFVDKSKSGAFVVSYPGVSNENDWFIDSAASFHMSLRDDWMVNKNPKPIDHIVTANNSSMQVQCSGQVIVNVDRKGVDCEVSIKNVLHIKELLSNLLSVSQLCKKGHNVIFTDEGCEIFDRDLDLVATGRHESLQEARRSEEPSPTEVACYWKKSTLSTVKGLKSKTIDELSNKCTAMKIIDDDIVKQFIQMGIANNREAGVIRYSADSIKRITLYMDHLMLSIPGVSSRGRINSR
ncbi:hypothetical protein Bhyg_04243, partial [Pseudolycoriella hygida]